MLTYYYLKEVRVTKKRTLHAETCKVSKVISLPVIFNMRNALNIFTNLMRIRVKIQRKVLVRKCSNLWVHCSHRTRCTRQSVHEISHKTYDKYGHECSLWRAFKVSSTQVYSKFLYSLVQAAQLLTSRIFFFIFFFFSSFIIRLWRSGRRDRQYCRCKKVI